MWFSRKQVVKPVLPGPPDRMVRPDEEGAQPVQPTTKRLGDAAESVALAFLVKAGLKAVEANYRTPGRGGGEIDLIMRARDGTLVFVEVRQRSSDSHGGAGASISPVKQQRIILAARHYLMRFASPPPCRFDVVLVQGALQGDEAAKVEWLRAAFDAS